MHANPGGEDPRLNLSTTTRVPDFCFGLRELSQSEQILPLNSPLIHLNSRLILPASRRLKRWAPPCVANFSTCWPSLPPRLRGATGFLRVSVPPWWVLPFWLWLCFVVSLVLVLVAAMRSGING